ncbi:PP2C family serine/threonine-protein phosphatase [Salipaludibacillus sp. CF4.18]|uniref:PP2C family serine/threonine-protein phosphatase n=1 Tax=Salipaludibacillus sp. CF4.18 TaxID=3373081 RepID=UPI003EE736E3
MIENQRLKHVDISVYHEAKKGNWCSGDAFYTIETDDYILCAVADGLGSGEQAMEAASAAMTEIKNNHDMDIETIMDRSNKVLFGTRGVVLTILKLDIQAEIIEYSNVGNITCTFYRPSGELVRPVPSRGYLCGKKKTFKTERIPYEKDLIFFLYSDGLIFDAKYHSIFSSKDSPTLIIERFINVIKSSNDDTTLLVGKVIQ